MATTGNLSQYRGEDKVFVDTISGVTDVAGWTAVLHVHAPDDPGTEYFQVAGVLSSPTTLCQVTFAVPAATTEPLLCGAYGFCIERTNNGAQAVPTIGLYSLIRGSTF